MLFVGQCVVRRFEAHPQHVSGWRAVLPTAAVTAAVLPRGPLSATLALQPAKSAEKL